MTTGKLGWVAAALVALTWSTAQAQTRITPEAFLAAVQGKTVKFYDYPSGILVGTEEFLSPDLSVWRMEGRGCVYGQITTPNGQVCFLYDDDADVIPVCWWPFLHDDRLMVRLASFTRSEIQQVESITDDGLDCPNPQIS